MPVGLLTADLVRVRIRKGVEKTGAQRVPNRTVLSSCSAGLLATPHPPLPIRATGRA